MLRFFCKITLLLVLCLGNLARAEEPLTFSLQRLHNSKVDDVTEKDFRDQYMLLAIGYTTCPDVCPTTLLDIRETMRTLDKIPGKAQQIQPLFLTIDPNEDSLSDITQYSKFFEPRIIGLRAKDYSELDHIVEQLNATYGYVVEGKPTLPADLPENYTVIHSAFIYLFSPKGELLDVYAYNTKGQKIADSILTHINP